MRVVIEASLISEKSGGFFRYIMDMINAINKYSREDEFIIYLNSNVRRIFRLELKQNIKVEFVKFPVRLSSIWYQIAFYCKLKKSGANVIHFPAGIPPLLLKHNGIVLTVHDLGFLCVPECYSKYMIYYWRLLKKSVVQAKKIITVSNNTKEDLIRFFSVPFEKIEVIYNFIPQRKIKFSCDYINNKLKKYKINCSDYVLYVGVVQPRKNLINLVRAYEIIKNNYSIPNKLVIAGLKKQKYLYIHHCMKDLVIHL